MKVSGMSGWTRILLVCWVISGIYIVTDVANLFPTQESLKKDFDKKCAVILKRGDKLINDRWRMSQEEFKKKAAEYQKDTTVEDLTRKYFDDVANIGYLQAKFIGFALSVWLAFGICIGAASLIGKWIMRGFRPKTA